MGRRRGYRKKKKNVVGPQKKAVRQVKSYQPWKLQGPVDLMFEYSNPAGKISHFQGQTVLEAFEGWLGKP